MKKFFVILMGILFTGFLSNAQGPVMPYNNDIYSVAEVKKFALGNSEAGKAFAQFLLDKCQRNLELNGYKAKLEVSNLPWLFDSCFFIEEVHLKKGAFENSYWDRSKKNLHFFTSNTDYEGMAGVFKYGRCYDELWKGNCVNGLNVPKTKNTPPIIVDKPAPPPVNVIKKDSVVITIIKKDSIITEPKKVTPEDDYEVEEKVEVPVVNNYTYTTNIYNSPQQGGPRRVHRQTEYYERRTGFQIYAQYRGGGSSTSVTPTRRVTMGQPIGSGTRGVNMGQPISPTRRVYMGQPGG